MGLFGDILEFAGKKLFETAKASHSYVVIEGLRKAKCYGKLDEILGQYTNKQLEYAYILALRKHDDSLLYDIRRELFERGYNYEDEAWLRKEAERSIE